MPRKPKRKNRPGQGRKPLADPSQKVIAKSISMHPSEWQRLDALRGSLKRGRYIASLLK